MSESETREFAYNRNEIDDECVCPAVAAGFDPDEHSRARVAAGSYDDAIKRLELGNRGNRVSEEDAKEAWLDAIEQMERMELHATGTAREIAIDLGWMEADDE